MAETNNITKLCTKCNEEKQLELFSNRKKSKDGKMVWCKPCMRKYHINKKEDESYKNLIKEKSKNYYEENKELLSEKAHEYYLNNKEKVNARNKLYAELNKNKHKDYSKKAYYKDVEKSRRKQREWKLKNVEKVNEYRNKNKEKISKRIKEWASENRDRVNLVANNLRINRRKTDPLFVLKERIRARIRGFLRSKGFNKQSKTQEILGCTFEEFKLHIESLFVDGMDFNNRNAWHIDHKIPLATAKTYDDVILLNHYTNLQPLWAEDNLRKSDKLDFVI